jgi:hypothetical protein
MFKKLGLFVTATVALTGFALSANSGCTDLTDDNYCKNSCICIGRDGDNACLNACHEQIDAVTVKANLAGCDTELTAARKCADTYTSCVEHQFTLRSGACTIEAPALQTCIDNGGPTGGTTGASTGTGN